MVGSSNDSLGQRVHGLCLIERFRFKMILSSVGVNFVDKSIVYVKYWGVKEPQSPLLLLLSFGPNLLSDPRLRLLELLEYQVADLSEPLLEPLPLP